MPHSLPNELQLAALAETGAGRESGRRKLYLSILAVNAAALTLTLFYVWLFSTRQLRFNIVQNGRIPQIGIFITM
ncbi:hypothetical protein Dxin01_04272 [Deinococcus xinjiangensis]|uniref:Uncharacterized protein n=1 Tax=Deinococcus xinjiangensis TaxID=457454 RepID=A0ABP9VH10_9DEIO